MSAVLSIAHVLHLTREQRYQWASGEELEVIGTSVPVLIYQGKTSEPAIEIFVKYKLKVSDLAYIKSKNNGYEIGSQIELNKLSDDVWDELTWQEKHEWKKRFKNQPCVKDILDIKDGGSESIFFHQHNKIKMPNNPHHILNVIHCVEIHDIQQLQQSLIFSKNN